MICKYRLLLFLSICLTLSAFNLQAQLSPGELSNAHSFLEGLDNCRQCHGTDRKEIGRNCLQCHKQINERIKAQQGLHGRNDYSECELCHIEHQGREFELVYWPDGIDNFDHREAGWRLQGKHAELECRQCHRAENISSPEPLLTAAKSLNRTFMGLSTDCASCHFDEHRAQLGNDCAKCHTTAGWSPPDGFDHDQSQFALTGQHQQVECVKCHPQQNDFATASDTSFQRFTGLQFGSCVDCHRDLHEGRLGGDCAGCHNTAGWHQVQSTQFDHNKTRYPLRGQHTGLVCAKCHSRQRQQLPRFANCTDCHGDFHDGEFASRSDSGACESCHTVQGFRPAHFSAAQHDSTGFPLVGAHLAVACDQCHVKSADESGKPLYQFRFTEKNCVTCHPNPHDDKVDKWLGERGCESCHIQESWTVSVFEHDRTEFALTGKHLTISCRDCHGNQGPEFQVEQLNFKQKKRLCQDCHRDIHAGQFAAAGRTNCAKCHSAEGWSALVFDHNRDSRYKLEGAHRKVPCAGCHQSETEESTILVRYKPLGTNCKDCHGETEPKPLER